eukprot:1153728-Pelagomonas_calceolata.AAC.3
MQDLRSTDLWSAQDELNIRKNPKNVQTFVSVATPESTAQGAGGPKKAGSKSVKIMKHTSSSCKPLIIQLFLRYAEPTNHSSSAVAKQGAYAPSNVFLCNGVNIVGAHFNDAMSHCPLSLRTSMLCLCCNTLSGVLYVSSRVLHHVADATLLNL